MFKSITKTFALTLLVFVVSVGASGTPNFLNAALVSIPTPVSPIGNVLVTNDTPTLKWTASTPAASLQYYEYEVSSDAGFSVIDATDIIPFGSQQGTLGAPLARSRTYFWHVRACDINSDCTAWSGAASFRVSLGAPLLVSPADTSALISNRDTFDWDPVLNASGYTIQIASSSVFTSPIIQADVASTETEFTPVNDLPVNQILYWHVRAKNNTYGPGPWSETWSFTTAVPPSKPAMLQPKDKKMTTDFSPRLVWSKATIPSGTTFLYYQVQVDIDEDFPAPIIDDTSVTDQTTPYFDVPEGTPLDPATTYFWRVRACNDDGVNTYCSSWPDAYFTLYTSLDQPAALNTPMYGELLTDNMPLFDWDSVPKAISYTLQVSRNPSFTSLVLSRLTIRSEYQPTTPLPPGVTLYWRVRGNHILYGPGLWSVASSFTTAKPPAKPILRSPTSGLLVTTTTPLLRWSFSSTPPGTTFTYYQIQIDVDPAFSAPIEDFQETNQYKPYFLDTDYSAPLTPIARYYWRVRACNEDIALNSACSPWSGVWNFRVAAEAPVNLDSTAFPLLDWDDVTGASGYFVEIRKGGALVRTYTTLGSQVNVGSLPAGTYAWRVRVKSTYVYGFAPSAWSVTDTFTIP